MLDKVSDRSYVVRTEDGGLYRRNRQDLLKVGEKYRPGTVVGEGPQMDNLEDLFKQVEDMENDMGDDFSIQENGEDRGEIQEVEPPQVRRSKRVSRPVDRLNL